MASPLLGYANALVRAENKGTVTTVNGRLVQVVSSTVLYRCFLKRTQYSGVSSGSVKVPLPSQLDGQMMPGGSGDQFYYRGYYLQKALIASNFDWRGDLSALVWTDITAYEEAIRPGTDVLFALGSTDTMKAQVERSTGVYGGLGIDQILYKELGGIELQLTGAELLN